jgi:hypothetical protein
MNVVEQRTVNSTKISHVGELNIPDPDYGDLKLNLMPFQHTGADVELPQMFKLWEPTLNEILKNVPVVDRAHRNKHYVTIDTKFFANEGTLRREGIHADGNFCVDPKFMPKRCWGGSQPRPTWAGAHLKNDDVIMTWTSEFGTVPPIGTYITNQKGGIFCVSSEVGCRGWQGDFYGDVQAEGMFSDMEDQLTPDKMVVFEKNNLFFMTSNTPHETLHIEQGKRRTFMRVSLNHNYPTNEILNNLK